MQVIRAPKPMSNGADARRKVLALCGDSQVGLWMLRNLAQHGLVVYAVCNSVDGQAAHSRYCAGAWALDRSPDAAPPVEQVELLAKELSVGSVMPISESFHAALIRNREKFEPSIHVFSSPGDAFDKATDKDYMHRLCFTLGVPVARGMTLDKLMATGGTELEFPLVLRTRRQNDGSGRAPWKAAYARDAAQLEKLHRSVCEYADNVIVQEYHPGAEAHVQVLMHEGEAVMAGEYIGEQHMPLAGGVTVQRVSCRHEAVVRDAVRILKAIEWEGIAAVQFHYDPVTDKYIFLEINPRFCGGLPTVILAGFDASFLLWQSHFEPEKMRPRSYRLGLRTRILGGCANWTAAMLRRDSLPPDQKHVSKIGALMSFLWNCGPWTKDDSFILKDPKPFFVDLKQMVGSRLMRSRPRDLLGVN